MTRKRRRQYTCNGCKRRFPRKDIGRVFCNQNYCRTCWPPAMERLRAEA